MWICKMAKVTKLQIKQTNKQSIKEYYYFRKSHDANTENDNKTSSGNPELPSHPAPPPGFADDNNQFYLTEEMDTLNINSAPVTGKIFQNDSEKIKTCLVGKN